MKQLALLFLNQLFCDNVQSSRFVFRIVRLKLFLVFNKMSSTKVKVNQGVVRGCEEKLPNGQTFKRFSGIPYAKTPVNELRFRSPQKLLKFDEGEIDCTKERDGCLHRSAYIQDMIGSEDCLYLNVYVPPIADPKKKLAVMVYIHGGGFSFDSSSIDLQES